MHSPSQLHLHPLFSGYQTIWKSLLPQVKIRGFSKDQHVVQHGAAATGLWIVLKGWVSLVRQTPDGKEAIVGLCASGDVFGEAALFAHASYAYTAQVVSDDVELALIPANLLRDAIGKHPELSSHVMEILGERIAKAQLKIEQMTTLSASQRLGCFLLRLCHANDGAQAIAIPVEKHLVASYLGMKPETLSRSFQQLSELGIRVNGAEVVITKVNELRDFVCNSCGESGMCDTESELTDAARARAQR